MFAHNSDADVRVGLEVAFDGEWLQGSLLVRVDGVHVVAQWVGHGVVGADLLAVPVQV